MNLDIHCISIFFASVLLTSCFCENVKKSVDDLREDNGDTSDESRYESLMIPQENDNETNLVPCSRKAGHMVTEIKTASAGQFPFMAALMSHQDEYICSGTVVSNGIILTSGGCLDNSIDHVLLNATQDKRDVGTYKVHVFKTEKFPTYDPSNPHTDLGLVYTEKHNISVAAKIKISSSASLANLGEVLLMGYGLNAEPGQTKHLQHAITYLEVEDKIITYLECIDTKVPTCFRDVGGPVIWDNELIGVVYKGENKCDKEITSTYKITKNLAEVVPIYVARSWLEERISKNENIPKTISLSTYPVLDTVESGRRSIQTNNAVAPLKNNVLCYSVSSFLFYYYS